MALETTNQRARRLISDTAQRAFSESQTPLNAAFMVAWGAVGCGDPDLALALFRQAQSMLPEEARERDLEEWSLWAVEADSAAAGVALSQMGVDWASATAARSNYRVELAHQMMRGETSRLLAALLAAGKIDPLAPIGCSDKLCERPQMGWLAWAAGFGERHARGKPAFDALLAHPTVRASQDALDEALWASAQYMEGRSAGAAALALLQAGADPFRAWPKGNRIAHNPPASFQSKGWEPLRLHDNPMARRGVQWFSDAEMALIRERDALRPSLAAVKKEEAAARDREEIAGKAQAAAETTEQKEARLNAAAEGWLAQAGLLEARQQIKSGHWPQALAEEGWCFAQDFVSVVCDLSKKHPADAQLLWAQVAPAIDWKRAPDANDGSSILAFLMSQRGFGEGASSATWWPGKDFMDTLLAAGCSAGGPECPPERDPVALAASHAIAGYPGSLDALVAHARQPGQALFLGEQGLARAARAMARESEEVLARALSNMNVSWRGARSEDSLQALGEWAPNASQKARWDAFWAQWREDLPFIQRAKTGDEAAMRARVDRQRLLGEMIALPAAPLAPGEAPAVRSAMRL